MNLNIGAAPLPQQLNNINHQLRDIVGTLKKIDADVYTGFSAVDRKQDETTSIFQDILSRIAALEKSVASLSAQGISHDYVIDREGNSSTEGPAYPGVIVGREHTLPFEQIDAASELEKSRRQRGAQAGSLWGGLNQAPYGREPSTAEHFNTGTLGRKRAASTNLEKNALQAPPPPRGPPSPRSGSVPILQATSTPDIVDNPVTANIERRDQVSKQTTDRIDFPALAGSSQRRDISAEDAQLGAATRKMWEGAWKAAGAPGTLEEYILRKAALLQTELEKSKDSGVKFDAQVRASAPDPIPEEIIYENPPKKVRISATARRGRAGVSITGPSRAPRAPRARAPAKGKETSTKGKEPEVTPPDNDDEHVINKEDVNDNITLAPASKQQGRNRKPANPPVKAAGTGDKDPEDDSSCGDTSEDEGGEVRRNTRRPVTRKRNPPKETEAGPAGEADEAGEAITEKGGPSQDKEGETDTDYVDEDNHSDGSSRNSKNAEKLLQKFQARK